MRLKVLVVAIFGLVLSGCASEAEKPEKEPVDIRSTFTPSATPAVASTAATSAPATLVVPSGVGMDYQSAQDLWRGVGLHVAPATDATGRGRLPVIDSNWVVLGQDPAAGRTVEAGTFITATVKKYTD